MSAPHIMANALKRLDGTLYFYSEQAQAFCQLNHPSSDGARPHSIKCVRQSQASEPQLVERLERSLADPLRNEDIASAYAFQLTRKLGRTVADPNTVAVTMYSGTHGAAPQNCRTHHRMAGRKIIPHHHMYCGLHVTPETFYVRSVTKMYGDALAPRDGVLPAAYELGVLNRRNKELPCFVEEQNDMACNRSRNCAHLFGCPPDKKEKFHIYEAVVEAEASPPKLSLRPWRRFNE